MRSGGLKKNLLIEYEPLISIFFRW